MSDSIQVGRTKEAREREREKLREARRASDLPACPWRLTPKHGTEEALRRMLQGQETVPAAGQCLGEKCCWWDTCDVVKAWLRRLAESNPEFRAHLERNGILEELTGG